MLKKFVNLLPLIIIFSFSSFFIFFQFNKIPKNISYDEIEFAQLALSLDHRPYTPYSPIAFGHSTLYFYIILLSFKIFGVNNFALRLPAAIFGIANVIIFYLILKIIYKKNKILNSQFLILNSLILLTSRWYLNFTRFSFESTFLLFLELVSIYYLLRSIDKSNWWYLIICGIFSGLAFNSYTSGRIFFFLPLILLVIKKVQIKAFLIPFLIIVLPLSLYLVQKKDLRVEQQLFLTNKKLNYKTKTEYLFRNLKSTILMFNLHGDMNGRHNYPGKPALNPILGIFFTIGLVIGLKNIKLFHNQFFLVYLLISLVPTLLTNPVENPNMLRSFTAIPSIIYFIGVGILEILKKSKSFIIFVVITFFITVSSIYELRTYFNYQSRVMKNSFEIKCPIETIIKTTRITMPKSCLVSRNEF